MDKQIEDVLKKLDPRDQTILLKALSDSSFESVFHEASDGILIGEKTGLIIDVNNTFLELSGYKVNEILNKHISVLFDKNELTENPLQFKALLDGKVVLNRRNLNLANGKKLPIEMKSKKLSDGRLVAFIRDISERYEQEKLLIESEAKFEKAFLTSPDAVAITKVKDGRYIDVNNSFKRILGYDRDELIGKSSLALNIWKYEKDRERLVEGLKTHGFVENLDAEYLTKDGSTIYGLMSARIIKFGGEDVILSITRDITDRKIVEDSLKQSERRFRAIVEALPDIFFRINKDLVYIDCYASNPQFLLHPPDQLIGSNCKDVLPNDIYNLTKEKLDKTFQTQQMQIFEYSLRFNNRLEWFEARMTPSAEDEVLVIVRNITDEKKSENILFKSEQKHRKLISNISDVIVIIDRNGRINYKSSNVLDHFGWEAEDLIGKEALYTVHPDDYQQVEKEFNILREQHNYKTNLEFRYRCKDGSYKPVELTAVSLIEDSTIEGIIANFKDISERKEAEQVVIQSQRLSAIGEMSSAIAHDFNNSLQSIFGNLEIAFRSIEKDHPARDYLEVIKTASTDAVSRVKLLQRFSGKSSAGRDFENCDINSIINEVVDQTRPIWKDNIEREGKAIQVKKTLDSQSLIYANKGEIRSALYNMIKNSIEALPHGGQVIIKSFDENNYLNIVIEDDGIGMDARTKSRVFQPFFSTKGFETGRGLGMSAVYSIIKDHGGTVKVLSSEPGQGTTFLIELPISNGNKVSQPELEDEEKTPDTSYKILWVDDDKMIREVAIEMLDALNHKGIIVDSGEAAIKSLSEENFDLVVTDIGMPGMSGWDLAAEINRLYNNQVKIVALTGWGDIIGNEQKERFGIDSIISKPVTMKKLSEVINKLLE